MLKRVEDWMHRVHDLHEEIIATMPAQYKNPQPKEWEPVSNPNPDKKDHVARAWTACDRAAVELWGRLVYLDSAIAERTGVCLEEAHPSPKPALSREGAEKRTDDENDIVDEPESPSEAGEIPVI